LKSKAQLNDPSFLDAFRSHLVEKLAAFHSVPQIDPNAVEHTMARMMSVEWEQYVAVSRSICDLQKVFKPTVDIELYLRLFMSWLQIWNPCTTYEQQWGPVTALKLQLYKEMMDVLECSPEQMIELEKMFSTAQEEVVEYISIVAKIRQHIVELGVLRERYDHLSPLIYNCTIEPYRNFTLKQLSAGYLWAECRAEQAAHALFDEKALRDIALGLERAKHPFVPPETPTELLKLLSKDVCFLSASASVPSDHQASRSRPILPAQAPASSQATTLPPLTPQLAPSAIAAKALAIIQASKEGNKSTSSSHSHSALLTPTSLPTSSAGLVSNHMSSTVISNTTIPTASATASATAITELQQQQQQFVPAIGLMSGLSNNFPPVIVQQPPPGPFLHSYNVLPPCLPQQPVITQTQEAPLATRSLPLQFSPLLFANANNMPSFNPSVSSPIVQIDPVILEEMIRNALHKELYGQSQSREGSSPGLTTSQPEPTDQHVVNSQQANDWLDMLLTSSPDFSFG